jgi:hypothetical protein
MAQFVTAEKEISVAGEDAGSVSICLLNLDHVIAIFPAIAPGDEQICIAHLVDGSTADIHHSFDFVKDRLSRINENENNNVRVRS